MLLLDSALDSAPAEQVRARREQDPGAFGVALATDESPPSQKRFGRYCFQVTMVYLPLWFPTVFWDASATPPLEVEARLLDICHCQRKDSPSVMKVVDKQLARVGLMRYEVKSIVGNGGPQNEGMLKGTHATFETEVYGYVRMRCLGTWHGEWQMQSLPKFLTTTWSNEFVNTYIQVSHGHVFKRSRPRPWSRMGWACSLSGRRNALRLFT